MIEFFIYTIDPAPVDIGALKRTLKEAGVRTHIIRNWLPGSEMEIVTAGAFRNDDSTVGCRIANPLSEEFERAIARNEHAKLKQWVDGGQLGYAMWSSREFSFGKHSEFESLDDAREQMGDNYAHFLAQAKRQYIVTNCNEPEFCAAAIGAVAMIAEGVVADPQLALTISAPSSSEEVCQYLNRWPS